ncbi:hypothetical protein BsBEST3102_26080 [Bacillus subtilis]|nr:hypothetical protein NBRC13719_26370 [Bacillus subtilis subsp. subtilis]BCV71597.1 hypothetical protein BsBEST3095_26180 [Bacillus subtilis]BCV75817.1 hypothetical protein BsBEST3096_26190 [Bacillus subtilis]BCV80048.1 hypothetical protein BsBEST3102_26080 [Bacillus subtilis]BCV84282.1 hypothetical protein BsBEST3106_26100 [Bacillus subtilis]
MQQMPPVTINCDKERFSIAISNRMIVTVNKKSKTGAGCAIIIVNTSTSAMFVINLLIQLINKSNQLKNNLPNEAERLNRRTPATAPGKIQKV